LDPNHPEDIPLDSWKSTVDKQRKSRDLWESMSHKFTSYVPRLNVVNRTELPFENCAEPEIIDTSKELKNEPPVLTYGHYGCYKSNKDAIIEEFDESVDLLVLIGGDVVTDLSPDEFHDKVMEAYNIAQLCDARMANFDEPIYMSGGDWWKMSITLGNWVKVPHFMVGNIILIFKSERENIINKLKTDGKSGWHSFDICESMGGFFKFLKSFLIIRFEFSVVKSCIQLYSLSLYFNVINLSFKNLSFFMILT
jgi:hypothetical protein